MEASLDNDFSLLTIKGGAAVEMVDLKLQEAIENIADINTTPNKPREVVLKIILTPAKNNRNLVSTTIRVETKLGGQEDQETLIEIKRTAAGSAYAVEFGRQRQLPFSVPNKVTPLTREGGQE